MCCALACKLMNFQQAYIHMINLVIKLVWVPSLLELHVIQVESHTGSHIVRQGRQMYIQAGKQADNQANRHVSSHTGKQVYREVGKQTYRHTQGLHDCRQASRQSYRQPVTQENRYTGRQSYIQAIILIQTGSHIVRWAVIQSDRQSYSQTGSYIARQAVIQSDRQSYNQTGSHIVKQSYSQTCSHLVRQVVIQSDRQSYSQSVI